MSRAHPPRPRLALRIGVTGHRPKDLTRADVELLKQQIHGTLQGLQKFVVEYSYAEKCTYREPGKPILRVVSSLAEGADRYVAHEAIALGFELQCPLPFSREECCRDFEATEGSVQEFKDLLANVNTTAVLELDGSRADESGAYLTAGRSVLSQSDVLLAIWNGRETNKEGGTAQIVAEAGLRNIPTLRIDSASPHDVYIRESSEKWSYSKDSLVWLQSQIEVLLTPPDPCKADLRESPAPGDANTIDRPGPAKKGKDEVTTTVPKNYFEEKKRSWNRGWPWKTFRDIWLLKPSVPIFRVAPFEMSGRKEWLDVVKKSGAFSQAAVQRILTTDLCDHYGWANGLAEYYGNRYRSAFAMNYLMGALAVFCAFLHFSLRQTSWKTAASVFMCAEFGLLAFILIIYGTGKKGRWHERWIDYRLLAEYLRQLFFLIPLGPGELSSPHLPKYMSSGDPKNTWMYWHYLALRREIGLTSAEFSRKYLESVRAFLNSNRGIRGQIDYHQTNEARLEKLDSRFAIIGFMTFLAALLLATVALVPKLDEMLIELLIKLPKLNEHRMEIGLGLCATALPAFGAALAGIRSQGEFERVRKRSKAMLQTLRRICAELDDCTNHQEISFAVLNVIAADAGQLMVDELLDWRIVFKDRPLPEPG
jgi:hypothetical protein